MPASTIPPGSYSKPSYHLFRRFSIWVLYLGFHAPWDSPSRQIPRPDPGLRHHLRVYPVWILGPTRGCVGIQKCYAGNHHSNLGNQFDVPYVSRLVVQRLDWIPYSVERQIGKGGRSRIHLP